jgi:competence protein ComEA
MKNIVRYLSVVALSLSVSAIVWPVVAAEGDMDSPAEMPAEQQRVNVNTATAKELEKLPGIGKAIAERIIAGRPYSAVEDLKKIEGVGDKTFEKIKDLVSVE